ncbi:M15 family metallopeptidase [Sanguibacter antarcticus]|uniref:D-alanyl-D-alanine carboxypeptidase-like protein n=1 Tax=Sanguibacter antarcticus TaxID=372484 RepID=A0A2A9E6B0_9MICO|nr:M15 family metallopeptidase [Sanguibacter antarcticus]PFG34587.1 D-alanyl-D-alanine carboxypeptidase-like protein [Sanguibacter antarcticus]
MPSLSLPRHPALRASVVVLLLLLVLVVTTSTVRASTVDAQQAHEAAAEAAADAEARAAASAKVAATLEQARLDEAERVALLEVEQAREALVKAIAAAHVVLDESVDRVADDLVRAALAAAIDAANVALEAPLFELEEASSTLADAQLAVTDAQTAWEDEQVRLEAEAAAEQAALEAAQATAEEAAGDTAAAPDAAAPADPAPASAQCVNDSTYSGTPFYTTAPSVDGDGSNGNIPASQMTQLSWGHDTAGTPQYLRTQAAQALDQLNQAYRAQFGSNLDLDLTYRSYASQVAMRNELGTIAAVPGTSTHGTGNALDVPEWSCYAFGSVRRDWLVTNGPSYGWVSPSWAREGSSNPEYWHYEYTG